MLKHLHCPGKYNTTRLGAAAVLALCVFLSGALLFNRLLDFSQTESLHYIPLTRSRGLTTVTVGQRQGDTVTSYYSPANHRLLTARPGFRVTDENTVWSGQTDIEIFRISYSNSGGQVTVNSSNGDKLLAPGTANTYKFALENTGNVSLKYSMDMQAYFSHGEYTIPVYARVTDHQGKFLAGSAESMADVMDLNQVSDQGSIRAGYVMPYTLEWEWPFEIDDEYDTMLGNLAVDEDITLTIVINTVASHTAESGGGIPQTGDTTNIAMMVLVMLASGTGLLLLLLFPPKKREETNE